MGAARPRHGAIGLAAVERPVAVLAGSTIALVDPVPYLTDPKVIGSRVDINTGHRQIAHGIDRVRLPRPIKPVA